MLTPYHIGPGLFFVSYFNFFTVIIGSVILDLEPFYHLFIKPSYPLHGPFHSFLGGIIGAIVTVLLILPFRRKLKKWSDKYLKQSFNSSSLFIGALTGCWLHILFDSFINIDMQPFWPLEGNPFLNIISIDLTYNVAIVMTIVGTMLIILRNSKIKDKL